jgi:hypothetical protein
MSFLYLDGASLDLEARIKQTLTIFDEIFVQGKLLCNHFFSGLRTADQYTAFFGRLADAQMMPELVSALRLDDTPI